MKIRRKKCHRCNKKIKRSRHTYYQMNRYKTYQVCKECFDKKEHSRMVEIKNE